MITFVIPCAPYHTEHLARAIASVKAQTMPCEYVVVMDEERRGAGWARNQGIAQVTTPLISFLDADDVLMPEFAAQTSAAYYALGKQNYIYTDWQYEGLYVEIAPTCAYTNGSCHTVTIVAATAWIRAIGGFNEQLAGGEDRDLMLRLMGAGHCGKRLPAVGLVYGKDGQRARQWRTHSDYLTEQVRLTREYGDVIMGCCGSTTPAPLTQSGRQDGDVLARPTWFGTRRLVGAVSGRHYGRGDANSLFWVDPRDVAPLKMVIVETDEPAPAPASIPASAAAAQTIEPHADILAVGLLLGMSPPPAAPAVTTIATRDRAANLQRLISLAQSVPSEASRAHPPAVVTSPDEPRVYFVRPEKQYPSYTDFWRLVALSDFSVVCPKDTQDNPNHTYIWVTPEPLPDVTGSSARHITWEFEYAGDYMHDLSQWAGEVWSSDAAFARLHDARFVLLGSHPQLAAGVKIDDDAFQSQAYDASLLGYMTPRRRRIQKQTKVAWSPDYPGHDDERHTVLTHTSLVVHVHQHDHAQYAAPLRYALAAAYRKPVISEELEDDRAYADVIQFVKYDALPDAITRFLKLKRKPALASKLHKLLCVDHPFQACVTEALRADTLAS